ncbi:MAG: serine hydrolase domain-containing protein, partial [Brevibacterium aurantiacum]|nr:beta-lactamase family protein [Brevibacterium aurantiacum]
MSQNRAVNDAVARVASEKVESGGVPGVVAGVTTDKETISLTSAGVRSLNDPQPMTTDSVFMIFSTTKALTGTVALQLVESGDLDLDAPAREYAPGLADVQVIEGFDVDGSPILRAPASEPTTKQLLLHTAGFGYDFFNEKYERLAREQGQPSIV